MAEYERIGFLSLSFVLSRCIHLLICFRTLRSPVSFICDVRGSCEQIAISDAITVRMRMLAYHPSNIVVKSLSLLHF